LTLYHVTQHMRKHPHCAITANSFSLAVTSPVQQQTLLITVPFLTPFKFKKPAASHTSPPTFCMSVRLLLPPPHSSTGERVVEELVPELLPQLVSLQMPANFVPTTNDILREMQRRGVSRDRLLTTLHALGAEVPSPVLRLLQGAKKRRLDVKILSDCNSVFISHILTGAKVAGCVGEVITNPSAFERVEAAAAGGSGSNPAADGDGSTAMLGWGGSSKLAAGGAAAAATARQQLTGFHRLRIQPRHSSHLGPHGCTRCPDNMCKGLELERIISSGQYAKVVYAGTWGRGCD
jgi:hypothetical protein